LCAKLQANSKLGDSAVCYVLAIAENPAITTVSTETEGS
jgi:hypothetical protein